MMSLHEHNEDEAAQRVIDCLQAGESLALVSDAGTPLISDPGFPLVRACREQGIEVVPIPGASALIAALSVSGLPTDRFRFEGFLPRKRQARLAFLEELRRESATLVFYESSHRVLEALQDLVAVFGRDRSAVMARELTKVHETLKAAPLGDLLDWVAADENQRQGEFVLLLAGAGPEPAAGALDTDRSAADPARGTAPEAGGRPGRTHHRGKEEPPVSACTGSQLGPEELARRGDWPRVRTGVGQTIAVAARWRRKVRAPQGKRPGNAWAARVDGKCNRKQTADGTGLAPVAGKGERVR